MHQGAISNCRQYCFGLLGLISVQTFQGINVHSFHYVHRPSLLSPHVEIEARHVCIHITLSFAIWCASLQPFLSNLVLIYLCRSPPGLLFLLHSGFKVNATLTRLLDYLLKMSPKYLQDLSRIVSLTGLVLIRRCIYSYENFIVHLILVIFKHTRWNLPSLSSSVPKEMKTDTKKVWHCFIELCSIFSITSHYNSSDLHIVKTNQGQATGLQFSWWEISKV